MAPTEVVLASPLNACSSVTSAVAGQIALVVRGVCGFTVKAKNAQLAGAIGVIVYDNIVNGHPIEMGGSDPTVTIPAVMISLADALALSAALPVHATLTSGTPITQSTRIYVAVSTSAAPNARQPRSQRSGSSTSSRTWWMVRM